jgi:hypothetical protein
MVDRRAVTAVDHAAGFGAQRIALF